MLKKIWQGVLYPVLIYIACSVVGKVINDAFPDIVDTTMGLGIGLIITIVALYLYATHKKKRVVDLCFIDEKKIDIRKLIYVIPIVFSFSIFYNVIIDITKLNDIFPQGMEVTETLLSSNIFVAMMVAVILAPMAEEIVFRGYIYKSISGYGGKIIASIVSALLFSLMHGNVVQGLFAFLATFIFIYIYDRFDNIYASIFSHIVANASSIFLGSCGVYYVTLKLPHKILLLIICIALFIMSLYRFNTYDKMEVHHE